MQSRTHRKTLLATTAATTLTVSATAAVWPERAAQTQASAPAGVTTDAGTIRVIAQERAFTSPI
jgi:hypothetical protein